MELDLATPLDQQDEELEQEEPGGTTPPAPSYASEADMAQMRANLANEQARAAALQAQLQAQGQQLSQVTAAMTQRQQQEYEGYLNSLDPGQRTEVIAREALRVAQQSRSTIADPAVEANARAQKSRAILDEVNRTLSLAGEQQVSEADAGLDWSDPDRFRASALTIGAHKIRRGAASEEDMAKAKGTAATPPTDVKALVAQVTADVRREMGIGGPLSATPSVRKGGAPSEDEVQQRLNSFDKPGRRALVESGRKLAGDYRETALKPGGILAGR